MKCLVVDTSTPILFISIVIDTNIKYIFNSRIDTDMSSKFMVIINEAFKKSNLKPTEIDKIFVSTGPGSFTGIRIGMTFAKTFALLLHKDLIPFSTLELFATSENEKKSISMIDARRNYVYRGIYNKNLDVLVPDEYISIEKLNQEANQLNNYNIYSYDFFEGFDVLKPNIDVLKLIKKHIDDTPINPHILNPKYLKKTEAEEKINHDK